MTTPPPQNGTMRCPECLRMAKHMTEDNEAGPGNGLTLDEEYESWFDVCHPDGDEEHGS